MVRDEIVNAVTKKSYFRVNSTLHFSLTCDDVEGWKGKKYQRNGTDWNTEDYKIGEASGTLQVACVEYCIGTGKGFKFAVEKYDHFNKNDGIGFQCDKKGLLFYDNTFLYDAYCNLYDGWNKFEKPDLKFPNDVTQPVQFACGSEGNSCTRSLIFGVDSSEIHFDDNTKTLTCVGGKNSLMAIEFNSKRYASLTCDRRMELYDESEGWQNIITTPDGKRHYYKVAESFAPLNVTCVKYCPATGVGINVFKNDVYDELLVTCKIEGNLKELFYGETYLQSKAHCKLDKGWIMSESPHNIAFQNDTSTPAQFECRKDPPSTTTITTTPIPITVISTLPNPRRDPEAPEEQKVSNARAQYGAQTSLIIIICSIGGMFLLSGL